MQPGAELEDLAHFGATLGDLDFAPAQPTDLAVLLVGTECGVDPMEPGNDPAQLSVRGPVGSPTARARDDVEGEDGPHNRFVMMENVHRPALLRADWSACANALLV